jgi:hypothetical protein
MAERKTVAAYNSDGSLSHHLTPSAASKLVASNDARWKGMTIFLAHDRNRKVSWKVAQSGDCGPLVLQVST